MHILSAARASAVRGLLVLLSFSVACLPAGAQMQYGMNPVRFRATVKPGAVIRSGFRVDNRAEKPLTIKVWARETTQNAEGGTTLLADDAAPARPCAEWVKFDRTEVTVPAGGAEMINFEARVPGDAVGFYSLGLVCDPQLPPAPPAEGMFGIRFVVRMVASMRIQVTGRAAKESLELTGGRVEQVTEQTAEGKDGASYTAVKAVLKNTGQTLLNPSAELVVSRWTGDRWLQVWRAASEADDLFPGAQVTHTVSTGRSWPSGKYRIQVQAMNEGRNLASGEFESEFESPIPGVGELFGDVAATMEPGLVDFGVVPNAARSQVVRIRNDEPVPIKVRLEAADTKQLAEALKGRPEGQTGTSCASWVSVQPPELNLAPGGAGNVRVLATAPAGAAGSYYADLILNCDSADGRIHGAKRALVWVHTPGDSHYAGKLGALTLNQSDNNQLVLTLPFWNAGNVHVKPKGTVRIGLGEQYDLACPVEMVLPEAECTLSAVVEAGRLTTGDHEVKVSVQVGPGAAAVVERTAKLKVVWQEGKPELTLEQDVRATSSEPTPALPGEGAANPEGKP